MSRSGGPRGQRKRIGMIGMRINYTIKNDGGSRCSSFVVENNRRNTGTPDQRWNM